jgi:hypothetical protein
MRIKPTLKIAVLVLLTVSFYSLQAGAYNLFSADPPESANCSQCHTDWPGATHTVHQAFACSLCHTDDLPVAVNACSGCHVAENMLELHSPLEGPGDLNYCGYCHEGTDTDWRSLGDLKALFR